MRVISCILLIAAPAIAETNQATIYTNRFITFQTLDRRTSYTNSILLKSDLDGVTIKNGGLMALICFTNLSTNTLSELGLPTNVIGIAASRAAARARANANYRNRLAEQSRKSDVRFQKEIESSFDSAISSSERRVKLARERIEAQRNTVRELERQNARDWESYSISSGSDAVVIYNNTVDSREVRLARYHSSARTLREARELLEDMEAGRR